MRISHRMAVLIMIPLALAVIEAGIVWESRRRITDAVASERAMQAVLVGVLTLNSGLDEYRLRPDDESRNRWLQHHQRLGTMIEQVTAGQHDPVLVETVRVHHRQLGDTFLRQLAPRGDGTAPPAVTEAASVRLLSGRLVDAASQLSEAAVAAHERVVHRANRLVLGILVVTLLLLAVVAALSVRAYQALRLASQLPEESPNPILRIGDDQRVSYVNQAGRKLLDELGWKRGQALPEILRDSVHEAAGRPEQAKPREVCCPGGNTYLLSSVRPASAAYVNIYGVNILERKRVEQALAESEARYRELVHSANSAIIRWRRDGSIAFFNEHAERLFGWKAEEVQGRHINIIVPSRDSAGEDMEGLVRDIVANPGRYANHINENICRDGRRVWMSWTNRAILDEKGEVREVLAIGSDVTDRKRAEEAVWQATRELSAMNAELEDRVNARTSRLRESIIEMKRFSYSLAHDMRAPLRIMHGFATLLLEECGERLDAHHRDYLRRIIKTSDRMDTMLLDALDYAKALRRSRPVQPVDAPVLLADLIRMNPAFQPPQAEVRTEQGIPPVLANATGFTQCCSDLLAKALAPMQVGPGPRQAHVWAERSGDLVRILFQGEGAAAAAAPEKTLGSFGSSGGSQEYRSSSMSVIRKTAQKMAGDAGMESGPSIGVRYWIQLKAA